MRVPHRELERYRRDPRAWVSRKLQEPPFRGMRILNEYALRMAVHWFHKAEEHTLEEAARKLAYYARKDPDLDGRHDALERLRAYVRWYRGSRRKATESKLRLTAFDDEPISIGGSVDRVDMVRGESQPMQAIFLGPHTGRWREELRMPLAQYAIADFYGWPPEEVAVGVQLIDGSGPNVWHYREEELEEALREFRDLRSRIADLIDRESLSKSRGMTGR